MSSDQVLCVSIENKLMVQVIEDETLETGCYPALLQQLLPRLFSWRIFPRRLFRKLKKT